MRSSIVSAVVQGEQLAEPDRAWERTVALAGRAADSGARLIVFPETWLPGYPAWLDVCRDVNLWDHAPVKRVFARYAEESVVVGGPVTERRARRGHAGRPRGRSHLLG